MKLKIEINIYVCSTKCLKLDSVNNTQHRIQNVDTNVSAYGQYEILCKFCLIRELNKSSANRHAKVCGKTQNVSTLSKEVKAIKYC